MPNQVDLAWIATDAAGVGEVAGDGVEPDRLGAHAGTGDIGKTLNEDMGSPLALLAGDRSHQPLRDANR